MAQVNPMIRPAYRRIGANTWLITETARAGGLYQVTLRDGAYRCTCPDPLLAPPLLPSHPTDRRIPSRSPNRRYDPGRTMKPTPADAKRKWLPPHSRAPGWVAEHRRSDGVLVRRHWRRGAQVRGNYATVCQHPTPPAIRQTS